MRRLRGWIMRFGGLLNKGRKDQEFEEELESHIQLHMEDNLQSGMTPEEARRQALIQMGGIESTKEAYREQRGLPLLETLWQDVRFGVRMLRKNPGFTSVVLLSLALGIGAVASVFSIVQGVLLKSSPYPKPEQIVLISSVKMTGEPYAQGSASAQWQEWLDEAKSFSAVAGYTWGKDYLFLSDRGEPVSAMYVTLDFFKVLGVQPQIGRVFLPSEFPALWSGATQGAVILGHELWQRQFHGDTNIIGQIVRLNNNSGEPSLETVVGVMLPDLRVLPSPSMSHMPGYKSDERVDYWMPAAGPKMLGPKSTYWSVIGRLRDGAGLAGAQAELTAIAARQGQADPAFEGITAKAELLTTVMNDEGRQLLIPLSGAVALVFLIACGSMGGLLLARGLQRQREYAVRCALGAGRWRLARQSLVENLLLAIGGGILGTTVAVSTVQVLKATAGAAIPRLDAVTIGWPLLAFCIGAALLAAMIAGLMPAFRVSQINPMAAAKDGTRTSVSRTDRVLLGWVATVQTALTLALLVGAGLLIRTAVNLAHLRPGYDTEHVVSMTVTEIRLGKQSNAADEDWNRHILDFNRRALFQVKALPGVKNAAWGYGLPLTGNEFLADVQTGGVIDSDKLKDEEDIPVRTVTPEYFDTIGLQLLAGRNFGPADNDTNAVNNAIINQAMASQYFGKTDPVGKTFRMILVFSGIKLSRSFGEARIVGVVANSSDAALTRNAEPEFYLPYWQVHSLFRSLVVRATGDPRSVVSSVQHELRVVDPTVAVEDVKTFAQIRNDSIAPQLFTMRLLSGFSILAGALALIGIYGVLSLSVASRRQEMAIRMAVGAQRRNVLGLILGEGLRLVGVGVVIGVGVAFASTRVLRSFLFGVETTDLFTLVVTMLLFMAVATLACYFPARRATQIYPMEALRHE